jgi:hypothetical protein
MARTDNDAWGVAEGVSVMALGAAEGRSREVEDEHPLFTDPFAQVSSRRGRRPRLVIAAVRQGCGRAVAGGGSAAIAVGASPIGILRIAHEVVRRVPHRRWPRQCPASGDPRRRVGSRSTFAGIVGQPPVWPPLQVDGGRGGRSATPLTDERS